MKNYKILTSEAAALLGKSELTIREGIKREFFEFGVAWQNEGCVRWNYTIYPAKLAAELGITVEKLFKDIEELRNDTKTA